jgi:hypothetical protein
LRGGRPDRAILKVVGSNSLSRVLFLAGAGAVKDSWRPVFNALGNVGPADTEWCPELANQFMATAVHAARFAWYGNPQDATRRELLLTPRNQVRDSIADELREFRSAPQEGFDRAWEKWVPAGSECLVATTNWDRVLDEHLMASKGLHVVHMHGVCPQNHNASELYLPTETAFEPYFDQNDRQSFLGAHKILVDFAARATRLVLYGLSVSPLDAELSTWLMAILDGRCIKDVVLVDPNFALVEKRLRVVCTERARAVSVLRGWPL